MRPVRNNQINLLYLLGPAPVENSNGREVLSSQYFPPYVALLTKHKLRGAANYPVSGKVTGVLEKGLINFWCFLTDAAHLRIVEVTIHPIRRL